ncbi:MAG TPA: DNA-processing protein DprA [Lunatimonas sp.]|nr:DNA-processing protein DprA [Lunatimonas sp.]
MEKTTHDSLLYTVALSLIPKIGPGIYKNIISYSGSAKQFFALSKGKIQKIPGVGTKLSEVLHAKDTYLKEASQILDEAHRNGVQVISYLDKEFPQRLKSFSDSPVLLFSRGEVNLNPARTIGIVGTRNATAYGKAVTAKIVEDLAEYKPTIISGLAYGIDIEAHRSALQANLPTLGILGTPINKIYPAHHFQIAQTMMKSGGLVSEYRIGSTLNPNNFPQRNRIIAGLSDALIVVEAAKKGGALITAEIAYSYNKEVFAVPGNLQSSYSEGCNNLIRTMKAGIYMGPKEIEEALSWEKEGSELTKKAVLIDWDQFDEVEKSIMQMLVQERELEIDQLSWKTNIPLSTLASKLLSLEFQGFLKALPGKKFQLIGSSKK